MAAARAAKAMAARIEVAFERKGVAWRFETAPRDECVLGYDGVGTSALFLLSVAFPPYHSCAWRSSGSDTYKKDIRRGFRVVSNDGALEERKGGLGSYG